MFCLLQFTTSFQPWCLHFCNFEKHEFCHMVRFHLLLILPSTKWHPYFREPTLCSTSLAGIVSPSKGWPTFKAVRFSMVDEKILSTQSHVADSNDEGGIVFTFYTRRVPLQGTFSEQMVDLKQCCYSPQCSCSGHSCTSVQGHTVRENNNFLLGSLPSVLCHH